jgi:hypothetical protein
MFDIQPRALLLVNINTCSISIDKNIYIYIYRFTTPFYNSVTSQIILRVLLYTLIRVLHR